MSPKPEDSKINAEEPDKITTSIAHKDSSAEPDDVTSTTAQKESSSDNKSTTSVESGDAVVPSPSEAQTVNVPTTTIIVYRRPLQSATQFTASINNNPDARRLVIPNMDLRYTTIDDALGDGLMGREPMTIKDDDVAAIKNDSDSQAAWVTELIKSFTVDYLSTPEDPTKNTPAQHEWFTRWQKQAHATLVTIVHAKDPKHLEKACWHLLKTVLEAHELGIVNAAGNLSPSKLKCSERLAYIVGMMEKYALVRLDVLRAWHVEEIAANPEAFIKRKLVNCWNNGHRAEKAKVAGTKRAASSVGEQGEGQAPGKGKKARKSLADDAVDGEAKDDGKTVGKTGTEHEHSVITPDSGDKEPARGLV
ncbi:hypothetical protein MBLNU13_g04163t3 [Cladosporium sp. NU13]